MNISRIILWSASAVIAGGTAASSLVISNQLRSPATACSMGVPPSRAACANLAAGRYAARKAKNPRAEVQPIERQLARDGYRAEPLSAAALSVLISLTPSNNGRQLLLDLSGKITRRNSLIASEAINAAATRGDQVAFFRWVSRLILTNNEARKTYIDVMAQATAANGSVEALTPVIGDGPAWEKDYWLAVAGMPKSLPNAAKLRIAVARKPWSRTSIEPMDERFVFELANANLFDEALQVANVLAPVKRKDSQTRSMISNGNFRRQPLFAPLDWQLTAQGTLGSSIDDKKHNMLISAIGGAQGTAARQLVRLQPGAYRFAWSLSNSGSEMAKPAVARIACAEPDFAGGDAEVPLVSGKRQAPIYIASSPCRWYWLAIDISLPDDAAGMDLYLSDVSLTPSTRQTAPRPAP